MITIDEVRALAEQQNSIPRYNGLGMIRLHLYNDAYMFYSDKTEPFNHTIHDHRYSFTSSVLKGTLKNRLYSFDVVDYETDYMVTYKNMVGRIDYETYGRTMHENVELRETCTFETRAGQQYHLDRSAFHSAEAITDKVITHMTRPRDPSWEAMSEFIVNKKKPYEGVYSRPMSEKQCWEIIENTINDDK